MLECSHLFITGVLPLLCFIFAFSL